MQSPGSLSSDKQREKSVSDLPQFVHLKYKTWLGEGDEGEIVEFRLIYKGPLSAQRSGGRSGTIVKQKHAIRRQFHSQLRTFWQIDHFLKQFAGMSNVTQPGDTVTKLVPVYDHLAKDFTKFNYKFLPLVRNDWGNACGLDILFLRRDDPGNLIIDGGDIDNRIKTLFDALKVPGYPNQVEGMPPQQGEDPFFCLLEDDRLITEVKVTTDRLLSPMDKDEQAEDVHLIIHVRTKILDPRIANPVFGY